MPEHLLSDKELLNIWVANGFVHATSAPVTLAVSKAIAAAEHQEHIKAGYKSPEEVEHIVLNALNQGLELGEKNIEQARQSEREKVLAEVFAEIDQHEPSVGEIEWYQTLKAKYLPEEAKQVPKEPNNVEWLAMEMWKGEYDQFTEDEHKAHTILTWESLPEWSQKRYLERARYILSKAQDQRGWVQASKGYRFIPNGIPRIPNWPCKVEALVESQPGGGQTGRTYAEG